MLIRVLKINTAKPIAMNSSSSKYKNWFTACKGKAGEVAISASPCDVSGLSSPPELAAIIMSITSTSTVKGVALAIKKYHRNVHATRSRIRALGIKKVSMGSAGFGFPSGRVFLNFEVILLMTI